MKRMMMFLLSILLVCMTGSPVSAEAPNQENLQVAELFKGKQGTIVVKNLKTDKIYVYNKKRSKKRLTPESTFKVPNALIGLETGAVKDEYEVRRWDGTLREIEDWNRDHTLASGMRYSVIWYYQSMARDIGSAAMQENVDLLNYGNRDIGGGIDRFWLDSSLKISAQEQIRFFENLVEETLPFDKQQMRTVKRIMINEEADSYVQHGKTGTRLSDLGLGWFVGYAETEKAEWVFAANIDGSGTEAKNITIEVLKQLKIISK
ncbi:class D beta-lactamase [Bacillus sp. V2I10]|uniref:class D beta-lactamase n=1 Tax=Bacillus sp. V2I10 TaxID=3042276 RepID=UPI00277F3744|nr:class D beta-lactamase [Bacillus sp. V2I10]MDQ0859082.1 beta-lactamase class D [Bacillus sp. V2I10]